MPTVLLTGATGYIGSHTWLALLEAGFEVVGLDDLSNSSPRVVDRLSELAGAPARFVRADVRDAQALDKVFGARRIDAVVHFAAFKAVGESAAKPLDYYANNVGGLVNVCQAMQRHGCRRMVYSSSATVYQASKVQPLREDAALGAASPYGWTKLMGEQVLNDLIASDAQWQAGCLRYFNPVGAHPSGRIGEDPRGTPNNLMPYVAQVALGRRPELSVFGNDYDTPDGTGMRDYIHVVDLAAGHVAALQRLLDAPGSFTVNLGTGQPHSVLEVVHAYERASGRRVPYRFAPRRAGDLAAYWADPATAERLLGWRAERGLELMCEDSWRWQQANPHGFEEAAA
jgi:UDP-glucose 4-epimerase